MINFGEVLHYRLSEPGWEKLSVKSIILFLGGLVNLILFYSVVNGKYMKIIFSALISRYDTIAFNCRLMGRFSTNVEALLESTFSFHGKLLRKVVFLFLIYE